jgi:hypothetical protein
MNYEWRVMSDVMPEADQSPAEIKTLWKGNGELWLHHK